MRRWQAFGLGLLGFVAAVFFWNSSWRAAAPDGGIALIAHRGVHQTYSREGLDNETCTAERIFPPRHDLLENTLPSMAAAFAAGAEIVEIDVHPTTDGELAVFHDWTLDCRTEGSGVTRQQSMATLKALDIGYGYTADYGASFPLRGKGVGRMPSLDEVLAAFPGKKFLVNFKSNEAREADMVAALVADRPEWRASLWGVYGGDPPTLRAAQLIPELAAWSRSGLVNCLGGYLGLGWTGFVPPACRNTMVMVPLNVAPFLWGWPDLFVARLRAQGSDVILLGAYGAGDPGTAGIDTVEDLAAVPPSFSGYVWTNRIEAIGPALKRRNDNRRTTAGGL
jgi:glycerophosphoryl diester phosphodiesterase